VPLVIGHLFPMLIPTAAWAPPLGRQSPSLGAPVNRALWGAMKTFSGRLMIDNEINAFRRSIGVAPLRSNALLGWQSAARTVMLVSTHYFGDAPPDWPPLTWGGFSAWPGPVGARDLDPAVDEFIDAGEPPVLVTLGSSAATGAGRAFATMAKGLDALGLRSLLLVGNADNLGALQSRPGVFVFAPVARVLPRCRVAVVSGALGTLAAALSAGVPVVVAPQVFDQVWHAGRVEALGVGIGVWRARDVAGAVARILADPGYTERARALAAAMAGEDGATALADAAESVL
jgi:UDP:flavonoid glycosyltransferase YjiC (YdhE family)